MGGASQGNQGIAFGARRQITSQAPSVPSLAEKERMRKQKAEEEFRLQREREEEVERKRRDVEAEEQRARMEEEQRWEEETRKHRDEERRRMEEQKRQWAEQERRWTEEEEVRRREDAELQAATKKSKTPPEKPRVPSSGILRGQTLSEYQREQAAANGAAEDETPEQRRVRELEKQLEEARERERLYQTEREQRAKRGSELGSGSRPSTAQTKYTAELDGRQRDLVDGRRARIPARSMAEEPKPGEHTAQNCSSCGKRPTTAFALPATFAPITPITRNLTS